MKAKVNLINLQLAVWSSRVFKSLGLLAVAIALVSVCDARLTQLRNEAGALPADYVSAAQRTRELDCLTRNIYWEAASEPFEGKVGVAQVTMNRVNSGKFASSVCGVVHQKNVIYEKVICQFSWYCENTSKVKPIHQPLWRESEEVAKKVLLENFRLPVLQNALFYHADYIPDPGWSKRLNRVTTIGRHIFYEQK